MRFCFGIIHVSKIFSKHLERLRSLLSLPSCRQESDLSSLQYEEPFESVQRVKLVKYLFCYW